LAKDVSSFANEKGGYIVIGLKHEPAKDEKTDVVTELDLMKKEDCQISSYCAVARQYIFPTLNVEANWIEDKNHPGLGIGYLFIPAQSEEKKPFIITRVVEEGEEQKAIIFGIAKRFKSDSIPFAVNQIYDMLQNGKNDVSQKLLRIESKVDKLVSSGKRAQATIPNRILETRIKNLLEKDDKK
jgi:predicted HTH transcriptional regulator